MTCEEIHEIMKREAYDELPNPMMTEEAAAAMRVHPRTVGRLCAKGTLKAGKTGTPRGTWLVSRASVLAALGVA